MNNVQGDSPQARSSLFSSGSLEIVVLHKECSSVETQTSIFQSRTEFSNIN